MKKQNIGLIIGCLLSTPVFSQLSHEFTLHAAGGISELQYDVSAGERKTGFGANAGLGYAFFFSPNWGVGTGVGLMWMNTKYELPGFTDAYAANDGTDNFELRYTMNGYTEKQRVLNVNIPLMLKFQTNGRTKFYASAGAKVGFPVHATYKSQAVGFTTSGYYPQYNNELFGPAFMGFGQFEGEEKKGDLHLKTMCMLSAEAGVKWKLAANRSLYTGAYIDYGLNNISDEVQDRRLLVYNNENPADFGYRSVIASRSDGQVFTDKIVPFSVGIKIALAFGKSSKKEKPVVVDTEPGTRRLAEAEVAEPAREEALVRDAEEKRLAEQERQRRLQEAEAARLAEEKREYDTAVSAIEERIAGYDLGQTELSAEKKAELDEKAALMKKYPEIKIICIGHTCDTGTEAVNRRVGFGRAEAAKNYLVGKGIAADRIGLESKGDSEPLVPNTNEENRRRNRRVEIAVNR